MARFDEATAVTGDGDGFYTGAIDPHWTIAGKPNGGYLLALLAQAATAELAASRTDHPHVLAASAHYLAAPDEGPVGAHVEILRTGRGASQVRARLLQANRPCVEALLTMGRINAGTTPWWSDLAPAEVAPPDVCVRMPSDPPTGIALPIYDQIEVRLDPGGLGFASGVPGGMSELRGWLSFADGRDPDSLSLLLAVDAFPPATLDLGSFGWVPTLELTAYVRGLPAPGPLRVRLRARHISGNLVDETCEVWDGDGQLVAQGTQLARVRVPESPPAG